MNVLIVLGHPRKESFCGALARAYRAGAQQDGIAVKTLELSDLEFDPHVRRPSPDQQMLEPDLRHAAELLEWAEHLVFVYPTWWGTMPALLKGFLDRLVMPGSAFRFYGPGATEWEGLWRGKSAQIITTMDTPPLVYRWIYRSPGNQAMRSATLGFCGVSPVHALVCGSVRTSTARQRARWLEKARRAGFRLNRGIRSPWRRAATRVRDWLRALRLQFYPMSWAAYTVGALAAAHGEGLNASTYAWGYLYLFFLEAGTVFANDYFDYATDRANRAFGPFTGGSRVLVEGVIDFGQLRQGMVVVLCLAAVGATLALQRSPAALGALPWMLGALVLTLGYTVPPIRLCYRRLGEVDVAFTHSALVMIIGFTLQGARAFQPLPWLLSAPLFLAILPAIILAGVPDRGADATVGKHTLVESMGVSAALALAGIAVVAAAGVAVFFDAGAMVHGLYRGISYFVLPHAALCIILLHREWLTAKRRQAAPRRIDLVLFVTLNYMIWFVALPCYHLLA